LKAYWILLVILIGLLSEGCLPLPATTQKAPSLTPNGATQVAPDNSSGNSVSPINTLDFSEITPPPAAANPFVKLAEEDLASRLNINVDQIHFLKITDIDWQDITQGCNSTPGQILKKGAVYGYQIWLEANGKNYLYHVGLDNTIFLCPD
jgi:hypothetical protein